MTRRGFVGLLGAPLVKASGPKRAPFSSPLISLEDEFFLIDLAKRSISYFLEHANPVTGMVLDRARNFPDDPSQPNKSPASIGATGFCLTALCIGAEREFIPLKVAQEQVRRTLHYFAHEAYHNHGWFYHFMDAHTGERKLKSEVSSIDTALLVAGMLTARQYFRRDPEIVRLAETVYRRMDFQWMLNGDPLLLSHGWRPGSGFIKHRWDTHSEHMILYLLGLGSPSYPLRPESWYAWNRPEVNYGSYRYISGSGPLFTHQYSQAWVDFRFRKEAGPQGINWFENSVKATRAHRAFCMGLQPRYGYSGNVWGVTASDSPRGYRNWGSFVRFFAGWHGGALRGGGLTNVHAGYLHARAEGDAEPVQGSALSALRIFRCFQPANELDRNRRSRDRFRNHLPEYGKPANG